MAQATVAALELAMKTVFIDRVMDVINYKNYPWLAKIPKATDFDGFNQQYPLCYEDVTSVSNTFSTAQANKDTPSYLRFTPTRARVYGLVSVSTEAIRASASRRGSYVRAKLEQTRSALATCSRRIAKQLFGDAAGRIGQVSSISSNTITLTNPEDVVAFAKGMELAFSANDGSTSTDTLYTGTTTVSAVDRDQGTVTVADATAINPPTGIAANDYMFPSGDFQSAFAGFAGWLPSSAPTTGDSWFGADRSVDPVRAAGVRFDANSSPAATGLSLAEKCKKGVARLRREGGEGPDIIIMNDDRYAELEIELEGRKRIVEVKTPHAGIGFEGIAIHAGGKTAVALADPFCPDSVAYMVNTNTWKLCSLGRLPGFLTTGPIVEATSDGFEIRVGGYGNKLCFAPGYNGRIDLDA